jgi:hypothetical protein
MRRRMWETPTLVFERMQRRTWEAPRLVHVGHVADAVRGGGGKLTPIGGDPGEMRKEKPSG